MQFSGWVSLRASTPGVSSTLNPAGYAHPSHVFRLRDRPSTISDRVRAIVGVPTVAPSALPYFETVRLDRGVETKETFARRLRRLRQAQGLSVAALAEQCSVPVTEIRDLEDGRLKDPELSVGLRLAEALSVDAWVLALGTARQSSGSYSGVPL